MRAAASYMPEKTDRYSGVKIDYDPRGLIVRRSKPTEMTGGWEPTGPDAGDWRYAAQAYDWQGRPTETTSLDGYTSSLTYGGCGCAGGETVTARDEAGRRRKLYKDTLGRLVKVEELDWDQIVYSTALYAYNARDQLTSIRHYQGAATSGAYQQRTLEYDGYGRLWKRTTPEQGMVEYAYNADDTAAWTRDARGAKTNFAYSARHLTTAVTFEVPGGVAATPNLSFAYDAAANRTLMTDGLGSVAYAYDSQSRLTQESRTLNGVGTFALSYGYDNAGLASVTNEWGSQVAYAKDHTGTVTAVTGAGPVSAPTYAQGLQYRAFGSLKQMTYGNARQLSVDYDVRMRPVEWDVAGVLGSEYGYDDFHEHTGKATYARDLYNAARDRSYEYDHVGRLTHAYTGANARAHAGLPGGSWAVADGGPYGHDYHYDTWGNITQRVGWGGWNASVSYTYANNRISNPGHTYDAAGHLTNDGAAYAYDATGQQTSAAHALWQVGSGYDGDRLRVKKTENGLTTYYLRSSVLGGQVVAEVNAAGAWQRGHVYLGGQLLAVQAGGAVHWQHEDPITKAKALTDAAGALTSLTVVDPWGGEADSGWQQNAAQQRRKYTSYERDAHARDEAMHRQYSGWYARFTQADPSDGSYDLSNPQSLNRYAYVRNDPVNHVDPSGLNLRAILGWLFGGSEDGSPNPGSYGPGADYWWWGDTPPLSGPWWWGPAPVGDAEGGEPVGTQQTSQQQTNRDCYAFADEVTRLLNRWPAIKPNNVTEVANELWRRFANSGDEFGSDGFRTEFADHGGSANQARHYSGGFMAATVAMFAATPLDKATGSAAGLGATAANAVRETNYLNINPLGFPIPIPLPPTRNQEVDRALNKAAAAHAHLVGNGKISPTKLGDLIKKTICAPRP